MRSSCLEVDTTDRFQLSMLKNLNFTCLQLKFLSSNRSRDYLSFVRSAFSRFNAISYLMHTNRKMTSPDLCSGQSLMRCPRKPISTGTKLMQGEGRPKY